jgi:hypothetical protein
MLKTGAAATGGAGRPQYTNQVNREHRSGAPSTQLVVTTPAELAELVREQIDAALAEHSRRTVEPDLVDGATMARRVGVSRATLHRLRVGGMPAIRVGDTHRYRPADVLAWLTTRST